jgi:hypothetical protein
MAKDKDSDRKPTGRDAGRKLLLAPARHDIVRVMHELFATRHKTFTKEIICG